MIGEIIFALAVFVLGLSVMAFINTFMDKLFVGGLSIMSVGGTVALVFSGSMVNNTFLFWTGIALAGTGIFVATAIETKPSGSELPVSTKQTETKASTDI